MQLEKLTYKELHDLIKFSKNKMYRCIDELDYAKYECMHRSAKDEVKRRLSISRARPYNKLPLYFQKALERLDNKA